MTTEDYLRRSPLQFDDPDYQACYAYWTALKGERWAPAWREWDWMALPLKLIPYFLVVDVSYDPLDFTYRFWGTAYITMHGIEFTNKSVHEIRSPVTAKNVFKQYKEVIDCQQAIGAADFIQAGPSGAINTQLCLRMPMSDTGERVDQIVTFTDWRENRDKIQIETIRAYGE